jgi:triosephosphate isomerase
MDEKPLIVAAHKLFVGLHEAVSYSRRLLDELQTRRLSLEVVISPSLLNLAHVAEVLRDSPVAIAAQNVHQEGSGAFTGQVSLEELRALGVKYVVIGHSEILTHQHDGTETLSNKIRWCVRHGVQPFVCITHRDMDDEQEPGASVADALAQLFAGALRDDTLHAAPLIVYEPPSASICDSAEGRLRVKRIARTIREHVSTLLAGRTTARSRVLYGGGVTPGNIATLSRELDVDGFFVGRASVDVTSFLSIVDAAQEAIAFSHQ